LRSSVGANFTADIGLEPLLAGYRARAAVSTDAFGIRAVELRAIRLVAGRHYRPLIVRSWVAGLSLEHYEAAILSGAAFDVALDLSGHIVAFSHCGSSSLEGVFVEPQLMGKGLGSAMLARAERSLLGQGVARVEVEVPLGAISFFSHRGYRTIAIRERPSNGGFLMLMARMSRELG
jgi:GNAT superfamily N-acetyltransferase